ncbi:MAG TPA: multicopper oxidase domain-containing protein, partial [Gemmatimonadales bacterium]|nr:multicopper oxidase domain-containing protein [Gemmatimonadales bacterium]
MILPSLILSLLAGGGPCDDWNPVHGDPGLHCIELVPRPEFEGASGRVRLVPADSPFGLAVTRDGVPRLDLVISLEGLPAGRHVAWASGPLLAPLIPLGEVRNGETVLGPIELDRFIIFVTADSLPAPATMGRIALRGMSPSSVLKPHITVPVTPREHVHDGGWEMPAPHPAAPLMTPGLEVLTPAVTPWRAGRAVSPESLPPAGPRRLIRLADGDTLALEAGMVRRQVAGRSFVAYAFNRQAPGPLIQVERGASVTVILTNGLDLPTSVHWHGIRLDHRFDGAVGVSQAAVPPGGRFTYELVFPDAGIYWYHPHVREDIQQELGLYGNILVR